MDNPVHYVSNDAEHYYMYITRLSIIHISLMNEVLVNMLQRYK